jgi:hypothetical protein
MSREDIPARVPDLVLERYRLGELPAARLDEGLVTHEDEAGPPDLLQASCHCVRTYFLALARAASGLSVAPDSTVSQPEY